MKKEKQKAAAAAKVEADIAAAGNVKKGNGQWSVNGSACVDTNSVDFDNS